VNLSCESTDFYREACGSSGVKIQLCGSGSDEHTPAKGNEHDESE